MDNRVQPPLKDARLKPAEDIHSSFLITVTSLEKPIVNGVFSSKKLSETENEIRLDTSHCKYIRKNLLTKNCNIDLKLFEDVCKEYENKQSEFDHESMMLFQEYLAKFVEQDRFERSSTQKLFKADIICHVKILIKMTMVHGDYHEKFSVLCTKYKGNIYITLQAKPHEYKEEPYHVITRHVLYSDKPNTDVHTIDMAKFYCVLDWKLGDISVMYFSDVQGVANDAEIVENDLSTIKIARIKTRLTNSNQSKHIYQTPYWWSQSLLLDTDEIHVAHINEDKVIESIDTCSRDDFRKDFEPRWRKNSVERVSFLKLMLQIIKLKMAFAKCCPLTVYEFEYDPKIQKSVHYRIHEGRNHLTFLTDKYIDAVKDL